MGESPQRDARIAVRLCHAYAIIKPPAPKKWVWVPAMRITAVHGLADDEPAMAAALQQLAALA